MNLKKEARKSKLASVLEAKFLQRLAPKAEKAPTPHLKKHISFLDEQIEKSYEFL